MKAVTQGAFAERIKHHVHPLPGGSLQHAVGKPAVVVHPGLMSATLTGNRTFLRQLPVANTVAPMCLAICTNSWPMLPDAAWTRQVLPACNRATSSIK